MELMRLWRIVSKRRLWVIVPLLAFVVAALVQAMGLKPAYEATAKVLLEQKVKPASVLGPGLPETSGLNTLSKTGTPLDTQVELARRGTIVWQVIQAHDLRDARTGEYLAVSQFLTNGAVGNVKGTDILAFTYRHPDPTIARKVADSWARAYEEDNQMLSRHQLQSQADFLTSQLKDSRQALSRAEAALRDFKARNGALPPAEEARATVQTLSLLEADLRTTSASYEESAARLKALRRQVGLSASQALASSAVSRTPGIQRLSEQLLAAETELALAKGRLTEENPEVVQRRAQVAAVRARMAAETARAVGQQLGHTGPAASMDPVRQELTRDLIQSEVATLGAQSRRSALRNLTQSFAKRLSSIPAKEHQLVQLERSALLASERLNLLQRNHEETKLKLAMDLGAARVVEAAETPRVPVTPGGATYVLAGALIGLGAGLALALLREYMDGSLKTLADAETVVSVPTIEVLPWHSPKAGLAALQDPHSVASEAYRTVRTHLCGPDGRVNAKLMAFTSAGPGEGTSTTVANLAVSFAQIGLRVLVVDADMGRPAMHRLFNIANERGLSDVLSGQTPWTCVVQGGPIPNLDVLTAGPLQGVPTDMLASQAMSALLANVREHYDVILVDAPPVLSTSGASILAGRVDAVVMVIGLERVAPEAARRAAERLEASGGRVIGTLMCGLHKNGLWRESAMASRPQSASRGRPRQPALAPAPGGC
jgi:capsular exopolysaccharide synthesis family protein